MGISKSRASNVIFNEPTAEGAPDASTDNTRRVVKLTPAEATVVAEVARGLTNAEIARTLGIPLSAVKYRLACVYKKLRISSRIKLMILFRP